MEFNLVYRWHSAISKRDEQWSVDFFKDILGGQDPAKVTPEKLGQIFGGFLHERTKEGPTKWEFGGLTRSATDGSFDAAGLVDIITKGTEDVAGKDLYKSYKYRLENC